MVDKKFTSVQNSAMALAFHRQNAPEFITKEFQNFMALSEADRWELLYYTALNAAANSAAAHEAITQLTGGTFEMEEVKSN